MKILENMFSLLNTIQNDKRLHYIVGSFLGLSVIFVSPVFAFLIVAFFAVSKELYDGIRPSIHTRDTWDAAWTMLGGLVTIVPAIFFKGGIL